MINEKTKIIMFFSPQGGTGKSTLAMNCSIFSAMLGFNVLLIDMAPFGSIMSGLRITGRKKDGLSSIIRGLDLEGDNLNFIELLDGYAVKHDKLEKFNILSHSNPIKIEAISDKYIKQIFNMVRSVKYDAVFIDLSSELNVRNIILLEEADRIIVPVIQDITCGWKVIQMQNILKKYSIESEKFGIVVNMCNKNSGFNNLEFEKESEYKIIGEISFFNKKFQSYINQGYTINTKFNKRAYNEFIQVTESILSF